MGQTFQSLLDLLHETKSASYRSDPEFDEAVQAQLVFIVQTMLEMLRDKFDPA